MPVRLLGWVQSGSTVPWAPGRSAKGVGGGGRARSGRGSHLLVRALGKQRLLGEQQEERRERVHGIKAHGEEKAARCALPQHIVADEEVEEAERVANCEPVVRHEHAQHPRTAVVHPKPDLLLLALSQDEVIPRARDADTADAL